jgi:hypothetical protein
MLGHSNHIRLIALFFVFIWWLACSVVSTNNLSYSGP